MLQALFQDSKGKTKNELNTLLNIIIVENKSKSNRNVLSVLAAVTFTLTLTIYEVCSGFLACNLLI
jgi:hypothetical protein